jgi:hypothetical protein
MSRTEFMMSRIARTAVAIGAGLAALIGSTATAHAEAPSYVQLQVEHSAKCLTIEGGKIGDADAVQSNCKDGLDNQLFELRSAASGSLEVRAKHSGKCLMASGATDWDVAQIWCFGESSQHWRVMLVEVGKGLYELRPVNAVEFCMNVLDGSYVEGARVDIRTCIGIPSQRWRMLPAS